LLLILSLIGWSHPTAADEIWQTLPNIVATRDLASPDLAQGRAALFSLDYSRLLETLRAASLKSSSSETHVLFALSLPFPDGSLHSFSCFASPIAHPALAAQFPRLETYAGRRVDNPAVTVRFDVTAHGFHAQILQPDAARIYIDRNESCLRLANCSGPVLKQPRSKRRGFRPSRSISLAVSSMNRPAKSIRSLSR
jgi:hypothetical protein